MNDNIKAGGDIHAGDGGYSLGTQEKYDEFVKGRNESLGKMRIIELAEQAGLEFTYDPTETPMRVFVEAWGEDLEKFAELIVRECADLCDRFQARDVGMQPAECAGAIRKMFGVKE